jgi:hypothetical protein
MKILFIIRHHHHPDTHTTRVDATRTSRVIKITRKNEGIICAAAYAF